METYHVHRWGCGYFSISDNGNVIVTPLGEGSPAIDMKQLVDDVARRGIELPLLLRFSDILKARIELLSNAFAQAIKEYEYQGQYRGVYPIKVNQSRRVVEEVIEVGRPYHFGLEAGSKPELLAIMAVHEDEQSLIICNGYKDDEYIETALLAAKLGRNLILVIEKLSELARIRQVARRLGMRPQLGVRIRLSSRGAGHWEQSGGDRSKFGLSAAELVEAVAMLRAEKELDCMRLLHFHLGSQISAIRAVKDALREAGRYFVELYQLGCDQLRYFDVGGGLGVDYDGSQTNFSSSMDYSVQEYANDVVFTIQELCDGARVPHPTVVTESGRAVAAHHSVLVVNVLGVSEFGAHQVGKRPEGKIEPVIRNLYDTYEHVSAKNLRESFHDALEYRDQFWQLFNLGHLSLTDRVACEKLFWAACRRILTIGREQAQLPKELAGLERTLSDTYFCNFSMFQSVPDAWAVQQLFPIMPIHRLDEMPTRCGVLSDITCDSDGSIDSFISPREIKDSLELHTFRGDEDYYLGIFLVGAYQEILGDLHNLFGDTNTVHVAIGDDGKYCIEEVVAGDTVSDVLRYVGYSPTDLLRRLRKRVEQAVRKDSITLDESRQLIEHFQRGMSSYTYLQRS